MIEIAAMLCALIIVGFLTSLHDEPLSKKAIYIAAMLVMLAFPIGTIILILYTQ